MGKIFVSKLSFIGCFLIFGALLLPSCGDDETPMDECDGIDPSYMTDIVPIVEASCAITDCHVAGFQTGDFTGYAGLKQRVDSGKVTERVIDMMNMPPENTPGETLTTAQIQTLKCWIANGAPNN